jgi:tetratricopeptide (TPR) repeat protein
MAETRLEQLLRFYKEDPNDPFSLYGLALEYQKFDVNESAQYFDQLLTNFPDYLPTYYHAAKLKASLGLNESALNIYKRGIDLAKRLNERKAQQELQSAYDELVFEME